MIQSFSQKPFAYNVKNLAWLRAVMAIVSGICAGILGLESLWGFMFYIATSVLLSASIYITRVEAQPELYFNTASFLMIHDVFSNLVSFVLFWTLFYGLMHVY
jgi:hypothetical protein